MFKLDNLLFAFHTEKVKPWFFETFFAKNLVEMYLPKSMGILFVNIDYFHQFFWIFSQSLVANKLMTSTYNRISSTIYLQPILNRLLSKIITLYWYWLEIWKGGLSNWRSLEITNSKKSSLFRAKKRYMKM